MVSTRARAYNGVLGAETPAGSRGTALVRGQGAFAPVAENYLAPGCSKSARNLPLLCIFADCSELPKIQTKMDAAVLPLKSKQKYKRLQVFGFCVLFTIF